MAPLAAKKRSVGRIKASSRAGAARLEERLSTFSVQRNHGVDLSDTMGSLLFQDLITCITELAANAYDADATHVGIVYDQGKDLLVVEDNGTGMDREGIASFYRIGDSGKREHPVSAKGRRKIGEFGVATLALKALCEHYLLETSKGEICSSVEETFQERNRDDKPIHVKTRASSRGDHGTKIAMDHLKFLKDDRAFTADELKRRLAVELPISQDFSITVNGQPVASANLGNVVEYVIDVNDRDAGRVFGSIFYSRRPLKEDAGIFIKVHGRAVGGSNLDIFGEAFNVGIARRVHGIVHADGLRGLIGLDRQSFQRDHPKFKKVAAHIFDILRQIRYDNEEDISERRQARTDDRLEQILVAVGKDLRELIGEGGDPYKIEFDIRSAGAIATLDAEERVLYINPSSPALLLSKVAAIDIRKTLLDAAVYALVNGALPEKGEHRQNHEHLVLKAAARLGRLRRVSLADVVGKDDADAAAAKKTEVHAISPSRLYHYREVTRHTGWDNALIKRMVGAEILQDRGEERILGSEIEVTRQRMSGYLSVFEALRRTFTPAEVKRGEDFAVWCYGAENRVFGNLSALQQGYAAKGSGGSGTGGRRKHLKEAVQLPSYIKNLAEDGKPPFWVINEGNLAAFKHFVQSGELREEGTIGKPTFAYCRLPGDGCAAVYLLRVEGKVQESAVREMASAKMQFVRDMGEGGNFPLGIRGKSWYARRGDSAYVLGIIAGDLATPMDDVRRAFERQGFEKVGGSLEGVKDLYDQVAGQRQVTQHVVRDSFDDRLGKIVDAIARTN